MVEKRKRFSNLICVTTKLCGKHLKQNLSTKRSLKRYVLQMSFSIPFGQAKGMKKNEN